MAGLLLSIWEYTSPFIVSKWEGSLDFATNITFSEPACLDEHVLADRPHDSYHNHKELGSSTPPSSLSPM
jgi:hypothetical protein